MTPPRHPTPLYDPKRHEPLTDRRWDPGAVEATIEELVHAAAEAFDHGRLWPVHPSDEQAKEHGYASTYVGASGVLLALRHLERAQGIRSRLDLAALGSRIWDAYQTAPDAGWDAPSLYIGALGVLYTNACLGRLDEAAIVRRIRDNQSNPSLEQLWGAPGSMLVAHHLAVAATTDVERARWQQLYLESARALQSAWIEEVDGVRLWEQDLYGSRTRYLGAAHGAAGNLFSLLLGTQWFGAEESARLQHVAEDLLLRRAHREDGLANWPAISGSDRWLVQWCHGAPGMITSFRPFPKGQSADLEACLCEAAELVWRAGPLTKGPSLCHGTAGNGYAFLQLFERTGDELWLDRARRFAMHAIEQTARHRRTHGHYHYTLFTGDYGVAWYLSDCLTLRAEFPLLDAPAS